MFLVGLVWESFVDIQAKLLAGDPSKVEGKPDRLFSEPIPGFKPTRESTNGTLSLKHRTLELIFWGCLGPVAPLGTWISLEGLGIISSKQATKASRLHSLSAILLGRFSLLLFPKTGGSWIYSLRNPVLQGFGKSHNRDLLRYMVLGLSFVKKSLGRCFFLFFAVCLLVSGSGGAAKTGVPG